MRKNQSNFSWLTNQKAGYVYRNLDGFEKWQSDDGNILWSYQCVQCPTVIFDRLLAFRCLIQQWIVPAEDKREKNWTINHLWYHNISSIFLEYTDVPPTYSSLLSYWAKKKFEIFLVLSEHGYEDQIKIIIKVYILDR